MAIAAAYKRDYGKRGQIIRARMDPATGKVTMEQIKIVVDESMVRLEEEEQEGETETVLGKGEKKLYEEDEEAVPLSGSEEEKRVRFNAEKHMMIDEASGVKPDVKLGEELEFPLEYHESYGRIAAQTAKQVIIQRIREAERDAVYDEYKTKEGNLVSGLVQRIEGRNVFIDIGRTVGFLPQEEQIPQERLRIGERVKVLILRVEKNPKGPGIVLSRAHPRLLRKLFEIEVPEIDAGSVEIKAIAREAGSRSKIAAASSAPRIDPVGSLVGQKGVRVSTVIHELGGEKIDIIEWSEIPAEFIAHALSPAKVIAVSLSEERREASVTVPADQLSLAIGKTGQNVRLAAKLTGWKIDVRGQELEKSDAPQNGENNASQEEQKKE